MDAKLQHLHAMISEKLTEIDGMFLKPPKITIVIRTPWLENGGVLLSNDDLDEAIAEIRRLRVQGEVSGGR